VTVTFTGGAGAAGVSRSFSGSLPAAITTAIAMITINAFRTLRLSHFFMTLPAFVLEDFLLIGSACLPMEMVAHPMSQL
jgi:hypothetical protein